jgi:hypothetical protein
MTNPSDGLKAFSGILQFLETIYSREIDGRFFLPPNRKFSMGAPLALSLPT